MSTLPVAVHPAPGGVYSLSSLQDEVRALPGGWAHSPATGHTPQGGACSLSSLRDEVHTVPQGWWGREETGAVAAGEFPKVPQRVFFFLGKILLLDPVVPSIEGKA